MSLQIFENTLNGYSEEKCKRKFFIRPDYPMKRITSFRIGGNADLAVLEETDEGFSITDKAGNTLETKTGYRCVLTIADGLVVYRD